MAVLLFLAIKADLPGFIYATELKTFDIRQSLTVKDRHVNDDVLIVTVDDESYQAAVAGPEEESRRMLGRSRTLLTIGYFWLFAAAGVERITRYSG